MEKDVALLHRPTVGKRRGNDAGKRQRLQGPRGIGFQRRDRGHGVDGRPDIRRRRGSSRPHAGHKVGIPGVSVRRRFAERPAKGREGDGFRLLHRPPAEIELGLKRRHVRGVRPRHDDAVPLFIAESRDGVRDARIRRTARKRRACRDKPGGRVFAVHVEAQIKIVSGKPGPAARQRHDLFGGLRRDRKRRVGVDGRSEARRHGRKFFARNNLARYGHAADVEPERAAFRGGAGKRHRCRRLLARFVVFGGERPRLDIAVGLFDGRKHGVQHGADAEKLCCLIG